MPQRTPAGLYMDVPAHGPSTGVTAARASRSPPYQPESGVSQPCPVRCGRPQITRFGAAQAARTADQVAAHSSGGRGHGRRGTGGRPLSDGLLRRATSTRLTTAAVAATAALVLFIPALVIHSAVTALPCVVLAVAALSAQNPPINAARPHIMPPWLWGAEGVRTLRTPAQPLAPLLFGAASAYIFGGGTGGLWWTFVVMLLPLAAPTFFLFLARRHYPADVAAAPVLTRRAALGASSPWRQPR
jgi:hypothetical protein